MLCKFHLAFAKSAQQNCFGCSITQAINVFKPRGRSIPPPDRNRVPSACDTANPDELPVKARTRGRVDAAVLRNESAPRSGAGQRIRLICGRHSSTGACEINGTTRKGFPSYSPLGLTSVSQFG